LNNYNGYSRIKQEAMKVSGQDWVAQNTG